MAHHNRTEWYDNSVEAEASRAQVGLWPEGNAATGGLAMESIMSDHSDVEHARSWMLPGRAATSAGTWQPTLLLREQTPANTDRTRPVLYIHGATFPSSCSIMLRLDGVSWADALNAAGFSVWALDFAGFGGSELYAPMLQAAPSDGEPLGRASEAADQIARAVRFILVETGAKNVSIIAHSWGTMAAGLFATRCRELVGRLVFFAPIVQRRTLHGVPPLGGWRFLTAEEQYKRFIEDIPAKHPALLADRHFAVWQEHYLRADPMSRTCSPPSVRTPNGPLADIMAAWSGTLAYDPACIASPLCIVRGEWDSLCTDADAAWLLAALTAAPRKRDIKLVKGTHLMHLEESRGELYRAVLECLGAT